MLRGVLADLDGTVRRRAARPARDPDDGARLVRELAVLARTAIGPGDGRPVLALAAGVSGIVDHEAGRVRMSPDLPGLAGIDVAARLEHDLGIPVRIDNDDLLAAVGEAAAGVARGHKDVVFLSLGFGLGAGILVDGRPLRGSGQAAGAVGFMGAAQLDERASGRAIPDRYAAALARGGRRDPGRSRGHAVDARAVFELAAAGDPVARRVVADAIEAISEMATDVAAVVDPEVIVLGGGLVAGAPQLVDAVAERLRATLPFPPRVVASALEGAAVVHGAVAVARAHARTNLPAHPGTAPGGARIRHRTALQLV